MSAPQHVVVVGQTPPPVHGQAVMVEALLRMRSDDVVLHHVRLAFSEGLEDVGRIRWAKLAHLVAVVLRVRAVRRATGARTLYLAVGGAGVAVLVRDSLLLAATRWRGRRVVVHVHGAGMAKAVARLPRPVARALRWLAGAPDVAVQLTPDSPPDGAALGARTTVVVPNGIPDLPTVPDRSGAPRAGAVRVLAMGTLRTSKGHLLLVEALGRLRASGLDVVLTLAGAPASEQFAAELATALEAHGVTGAVSLPGQVGGAEKDALFASHDVLAHPSWFENQSITVMEAMRAGLPVVATAWPGVESLVEDGVTGLVVPLRDVPALAAALEELARDAERRRALGAAGRARFVERFTEERFHEAMAGVLAGRP